MDKEELELWIRYMRSYHEDFFRVYASHLLDTAMLSIAFLEVLSKYKSLSINKHELFTGALLHDIGKDTVVENKHILELVSKPVKLSINELSIVKKHPENGYNLLIPKYRNSVIGEIVLYHHERWDGNGYPMGLAKTDIPISARIVAITDSFMAMMDPFREYKQFKTETEALQELALNAGKQFDPELVKIFIDNYKEIKKLFFLSRSMAIASTTFKNPFSYNS